jgi:mannosidase alpha-like ER degradation enhancer 1
MTRLPSLTPGIQQATKDSFYLQVGERILHDIVKRTKTRCGFAVIHDIRTGKVRHWHGET